MQKYVFTVFQQGYSDYTMASSGRHEHTKFSTFLHDSLVVKRTEAKAAAKAEDEAKKKAEDEAKKIQDEMNEKDKEKKTRRSWF